MHKLFIWLQEFVVVFLLPIRMPKNFLTVVIYTFNVKWLKEILNDTDFMGMFSTHSEWNMLVIHILSEANPQWSAYKEMLWKNFAPTWMDFSAQQMEWHHLFDRKWEGRYPYTKGNSLWLLLLIVCPFKDFPIVWDKFPICKMCSWKFSG